MGEGAVPGGVRPESRAATIIETVAMAPHQDEVRAALRRLNESAVFHSAKRAQEFLTYVVEQTLAGRLDHLKERCIGAALFGRKPDYDTGGDAIVRSTANDVRKRLARYYTEEGLKEIVVFELRTGSYVPDIHRGAVHTSDTPLIQRVVSPLAPRSSSWRLAAIAGWSAVAIILLWFSIAPSRVRFSDRKVLRSLPWVAMFQGDQTPQLIMADGGLWALRKLHPFPRSLEEYIDRRFLQPLPGVPPELDTAWRRIAPSMLTSVADARIAAEFSRLANSAGRNAVIRFAREVQLADLRRGDNLILLGGELSNPWTELFQDQLDFQLRFDLSQEKHVVQTRRPGPGDPTDLSSSIPTGATGEAYGVVALVHGLNSVGRVLIIAGTNTEGTGLAGEFAFNPDGIAGALRHCGIQPTNPDASFQVLLRLQSTGGSARSFDVLATHCKSTK